MSENNNNTNVSVAGDVIVGRNATVGNKTTMQGDVVCKHSLRVEGYLDAPNMMSSNRGAFPSLAALQAAYPNPEAGWYAYVAETVQDAASNGNDDQAAVEDAAD